MANNGLPYYPRYPRDLFEGTAGMPITDKGPYSLIIDLIYMHDGALPDNRQYIAGMLGMSVRGLNLVIPRLVEAGKLSVTGGVITNPKADAVLHATRAKRPPKGVIGGLSQDHPEIIGGSSRDYPPITEENVNEINDASRARVNQNQNQNHKDGGGGGEVTPFRVRILAAMGLGESGLTGRGGTMLGTQADMAEVARWLALPGMSAEVMLAEVRDIMGRKTDGPPSSFKYFRPIMQRLSDALVERGASQTGGKGNEPSTGRPGPPSSGPARDAETLTRIVRAAAEEAERGPGGRDNDDP